MAGDSLRTDPGDVPAHPRTSDGPRGPEGVAGPGWGELGVRRELVGEWEELGFSPFEAALAQAAGYGPAFADRYRRQLGEEAAGWRDVGLASEEGLRWQQAGFGAAEAARWRSEGVGIGEAARRAGKLQQG